MRALPGVVVGASAVLVTGLLWWGTEDQRATAPDNAATALAPPDGYRAVGATDGVADVTEHARLTGPQLVVTSPYQVGGVLAATLDGDPFAWRFWRSTSTSYDADGSAEQTTTVRRLTDAGVEQAAAFGPVALVFDPPLLEIPADVEPGSEWSGSGSVVVDGDDSGEVGYEGEFEAADDGDGCLRVTGSLTFTQGGETLLDNPTDERWCPGLGIVAEESAGVGGLDGSTEPLEPAVEAVEEWTEHDRPFVIASNVASAAESGGQATLSVAVPPVAGGDGRVLVADQQSRDVYAFDPLGDGTRVRAWVAHPGGDVLTLTAAGDVTVAGTSRREVVGYGPHGEWRWTHGLDDVPSGPTLAVDEEHLVVTSASGDVVVLDPASGEELWRDVVADRVRLRPVSDGRTVVVTDVAGGLTAYDVDDGTRLWDAEATGVDAVGLVDDVVVVRTPDAVQAFEVDGGARRWSSRIPFAGGPRAVADLGSTVAVSSDEGTVGLSTRDGEERWRAAGADTALPVDGHLFLLDGRKLSVVDPRGDRLRGWTLSGLRGSLLLAPTADSLLVMDSSAVSVEVGP